MNMSIRIAVALLALSFFGSSAQAVDLPTPAIMCPIGHFFLPASLVPTSAVTSIINDDRLVKNVDVSDATITLLKKCIARRQQVKNGTGTYLEMPLASAGAVPYKRRVTVIFCTTAGNYLYAKTLAADTDFTVTLSKSMIATTGSNSLLARCKQ